MIINSEEKWELERYNRETINKIELMMVDGTVTKESLLNIVDRISLTLGKVIEALPDSGSRDGY